MVEEQFAACVAVGGEVGVEGGGVAHLGVEREGEVVVGGVHFSGVEGGVVVDGAEEVAGDALLASGQLAEGEGVDLGARQQARVAQGVVGGRSSGGG